MTLTELATTIGASPEVATTLLKDYGIDLSKITPKEVESLATIAKPGLLAAKQPKKTPAKQLSGGTGVVQTQSTTATVPVCDKSVSIPALDVLENQLDVQGETLNADAEALIRSKMAQMKGDLRNTVINTMSEYAQMPDFFELGALFNTAPMLEPTTPKTIGQMQESIEVQAQAV